LYLLPTAAKHEVTMAAWAIVVSDNRHVPLPG
jgi:hypothetical protein